MEPEPMRQDALAAAEAAIRYELRSSRDVNADALARAALEAAAPILAEAWGVKQQHRTPQPGMDGLVKVNADRARIAGRRDADLARRGLGMLGAQCSQRMRAVAEARIANPEASWNELAADLGMTKDAALSLFRRLGYRVHIAQQRAARKLTGEFFSVTASDIQVPADPAAG